MNEFKKVRSLEDIKNIILLHKEGNEKLYNIDWYADGLLKASSSSNHMPRNLEVGVNTIKMLSLCEVESIIVPVCDKNKHYLSYLRDKKFKNLILNLNNLLKLSRKDKHNFINLIKNSEKFYLSFRYSDYGEDLAPLSDFNFSDFKKSLFCSNLTRVRLDLSLRGVQDNEVNIEKLVKAVLYFTKAKLILRGCVLPIFGVDLPENKVKGRIRLFSSWASPSSLQLICFSFKRFGHVIEKGSSFRNNFGLLYILNYFLTQVMRNDFLMEYSGFRNLKRDAVEIMENSITKASKIEAYENFLDKNIQKLVSKSKPGYSMSMIGGNFRYELR